MWTVLNQYTALFTLTIVALVHGALVHNCTENQNHCIHLLKEIQESIKNAMNRSAVYNKIQVPSIKKLCKKDVFCLAQKSLENISHSNKTAKQTLEVLTRQLKKYNTLTSENECNLQNQHNITLPAFLYRLDRCACKAYNCTT